MKGLFFIKATADMKIQKKIVNNLSPFYFLQFDEKYQLELRRRGKEE